MLLVANQHIQTPPMPHIKSIVVGEGYNIADDKIEELVDKMDLVITSDIPLADRIIKKGAYALSPRGEMFDEENIGQKLSVRDLFEELRSCGMETGGSSAYGQRDRNEFVNALDRFLTQRFKKQV